jgi:hypothetical protein
VRENCPPLICKGFLSALPHQRGWRSSAQKEKGRATWTRPVFRSRDGAPGTAQHVSITDPISDAHRIARIAGHVQPGVALPTGADAHAPPPRTSH